MNYFLIKTWEALKLSSDKTPQKNFNKTYLLPLSPPDIDTNHQACLDGTKKLNRDKSDDIVSVVKASIGPIYMEEVRTTDPMVILRQK